MQSNAGAAQRSFGDRTAGFIKASPARMAVIIAAVLFIITTIINPKGFNPVAIGSIIMLTTLLTITASGQTIVLISGGMDFSVGAVMSSAAILTTYVMDGVNGRILLVMGLALAMGALIGLCNGLCCTRIGLPPMIITMAISNVVTRLEYVLTAGSPVGHAAPDLMRTVTFRIGGLVPTIVFYAAVIFPLILYLLNRSRFGKQIYMLGNNKTAAQLNGVRVNRMSVLAYVFSGLLSALAGVLGAAYMNSAKCQGFDHYAFTSLVAVIVGGTSFSGGVGSFGGTLAGALLMTVLSNMLTTLALPQSYQNILNGVIVFVLLILYNRSKAVRQ